MLAVTLGLIVYVAWGSGDIFAAIASRKIGATKTSFYVSRMGFILTTIALFFIPHDFSLYTPGILLLNIFLSFFAIVGNLSLNYGLKTSNASIVGIIGGSFTALVVLFSAIFFKIPVTGMEWVAITIIFLGIFLSSVKLEDLRSMHLNDKSVLFGFGAMLSWAIYFTFIKIVIDKVGWFLPLYITTITAVISLFFFQNNKEEIVPGSKKGILFYIFATTLCLRSGDFLLNFGISKGLTAIVAPIGGAYPTLFVALSLLVLKDKITKFQVFGIIVTLIGIVLLSSVSY